MLKGIKNFTMGFVVGGLSGFLRLLPGEAQAVIKSKINPSGKMDLKGRDIMMVWDSKTQIYKSKACKDEPETVKWIKDNFRSGDVFYDVGANVGAFSFVAWDAAGGDCKIYAMEPSFSTFDALCRNIILNKAQNEIKPFNIALGAKTELAELFYTSTVPGKCQHAIGSPKNSNRENFIPQAKLSVPCYRLDDLIKNLNLPRPNCMKIDVDGLELEILKGSDETLKDPALRTILVEVNSEESAIDSLLGRYGFRAVHLIRGNKIYARK